jgi:hypothetical protein
MSRELSLQEKARLGKAKYRRAKLEEEAAQTGRPVAPPGKYTSKLSAANLTDQLVAIWPTWLDQYETRYGKRTCLSTRCWRIEGDEARGPRSLGLWTPALIKLPKHAWAVGRIRRRGNSYVFEPSGGAEMRRVLGMLPDRGS